MLVLSRKIGEWINIYTSDGIVKIKVNEVRDNGERFTLVFDAPRNIKILRAEIEHRIPNMNTNLHEKRANTRRLW
jgi:carbon storage regulator CsrA